MAARRKPPRERGHYGPQLGKRASRGRRAERISRGRVFRAERAKAKRIARLEQARARAREKIARASEAEVRNTIQGIIDHSGGSRSMAGSILKLLGRGVLGSFKYSLGRAIWGAALGGYYAHNKLGYNSPEDIIKAAAVGAVGFAVAPKLAFSGAFWGAAGKAAAYTGFGALGVGLHLGERVVLGKAFRETIFGAKSGAAEWARYFLQGKGAGLIGVPARVANVAGGFLLNHPTLTMGLASAGIIYNSFAGEEPVSAAPKIYNAAQQYVPDYGSLAASTQGLVQGLHAGRHGGY